MSIQVKVPILPESVADATVATWHKQPGDTISRDENLVDIETDKVMLEVPSPEDGVLKEIIKGDGTTVTAEEVIAVIEPGAVAAKPAANVTSINQESAAASDAAVSPAVRRLLDEHGIEASAIQGTGKDGRIIKEDVLNHVKNNKSATAPAAPAANQIQQPKVAQGMREEKRVPMSRLRKRIAERLLQSQQTAAILTTFNEVDLKPIMDIRKKYQEQFVKKHDVKLGFMSFFIKASVEALKRSPVVNASIDGDDIVYHGYFDIGVAVSTDKGLVVPIIRDVDQMSLAEIELAVNDYGKRAREGRLDLDDMQGGTFTVSNGGIFGSLLSTPIVNPPQSAILGMHKIEERAVVVNGEIVIRPMMYIAMSYDHRIIDGKESVTFLKTIKELLEDPTRLILDI